MELLEKYFNISERQKKLFVKFKELFIRWNSKVNLVSRKDIEFFDTRHLLHSLALAKFIDFKKSSVVDIGTGGGLPGIALAIMYPDASFLLIDSIGKKIKAVQEMISELGLTNVKALKIRSNDLHQKFDYVVARAVTNFPNFYLSVNHLLRNGDAGTKTNGIIYLKGGDFNEELKIFKSKIYVENISDYFQEEFFETKKIIHYIYTGKKEKININNK